MRLESLARSRRSLWLLFTLFLVFGTYVRLYVLVDFAFLSEMQFEEGPLYFLPAYRLGFFDSLAVLDSGYLSLVPKVLAHALIHGFGVVESFPQFFKLATTLIFLLCYSLLLADRFAWIAPRAVRFIVCLLATVTPLWHHFYSFNVGYSLCLFLVFFLLEAPPDHQAAARLRWVGLTVLAIFAAISKPHALAFLPLYFVRLVYDFRKGRRMAPACLAIVLLAMLVQIVILSRAYPNALDPTGNRATGFGLVLENWLGLSGLGPVFAFLPAPTLAAVSTIRSFPWWMAFGAVLNFLFARQFLSRLRLHGFAGAFPYLIFPISALGMVIIASAGHAAAWETTWRVARFSLTQWHRERHAGTPLLFWHLAALALVGSHLPWRRWINAALPAFLLLLTLHQTHFQSPFNFRRAKVLSQWATYFPRLKTPMTCLPTKGNPNYAIGVGCHRLGSMKLGYRPLPLPPWAAENETRISTVVVDTLVDRHLTDPHPVLSLRMRNAHGVVTTIGSASLLNQRYLYFAIPQGTSAVRELSLVTSSDSETIFPAHFWASDRTTQFAGYQ